jgi:hypothetical protein
LGKFTSLCGTPSWGGYYQAKAVVQKTGVEENIKSEFQDADLADNIHEPEKYGPPNNRQDGLRVSRNKVVL